MTEEPPQLRINDGRERTISVDSPQVVIGNGTGCDIVVDDPKCSRRHCKLEHTPQGWVVTDLESRHGTMVNGSYANRFQLHDGDHIEIGSTEILFQVEEETSASTDTEDRGGTSFTSSEPASPSPLGREGSEKGVISRRESGWKMYGALFLIVFVAGGVGYYFVNQNRMEVRSSRRAFWNASRLFEQGKIEEALSTFRNVSESTSDLHQIAQQTIKKAQSKREKDQILTERQKTEEKFRELIHAALAGQGDVDERKKSFQDFRNVLNNLPPQAQESVWYTHYENNVDLLEKRVQKQAKVNGAKEISQKWQETRRRARALRDNNKYGQAANRIVRFRYLYPNSGFGQEMNSELMKIEVNAEAHLDSQTDQISKFIENDEAERAMRSVRNLRDQLYSYYDPISSFYIKAVRKEMNARRKLDKTSDSS